jgi:fermentation-respiration switch protein FrsA (DUF1100 family)
MEDQTIKEKIQFKSDGLILVGNLYKPKNFNTSKKYSAIVTGGSLTSVKEQMSGLYAEKLAENGLVSSAFDYRNYGESEGEPRQYEDLSLKLKDLEAAVTYLLSLPYVKTVGALGVCTLGGNMAYLASDDKRVKALAIVAAHLDGMDTQEKQKHIQASLRYAILTVYRPYKLFELLFPQSPKMIVSRN